MREPPDRDHFRAKIEPQEFELIAKVVRAFRTPERDELQAELAKRLLDLKHRAPAGIRDWNAYLAKFLYNKASNWVKSARIRERRQRSLDQPDPQDPSERIREPPEPRETEPGAAMALAQLWEELSPELRQFWTVLLEERGNQSAATARLGMHRNTARAWRSDILKVLNRHGFAP